jgi:hypothetical protein
MGKLATKTAAAATSAIVKAASRPEIALLYQKDRESYWVRGYELFDPEFLHSTNGGRQALKIKTARTRPGCVWVMMRGQCGKPVQYHQSRVTIVQPEKHYFTFQEVFGSGCGTGVVVLNAEIEDDQDDDLAMGLTVEVTAEETDA